MSEKKEGINKKNIFSLLVVGLFLILSINFVSSAITVVSPVNYSNFSGAFGPLVFFNVSYINGTDFTDAKNVTFYYNLSGVWTKIGSGAPATGCSKAVAGSLESCNVSLNLSGLTDGFYSINVTLANLSTVGTAGANNYLLYGATGTGTTNVIMLDSTPPNVSFSGITNTMNNGNYSGIKYANVSVSNWPAGISSVYFNVTYANGTQVSFTQALLTTSPYYNITLNTSTLYDGLYNLTVYANDTVNNFNRSQYIQIVVDNTVPTPSLNCTPVNANRGQIVTCICSAGTGISGVGSGSFSDSANPDDNTLGTFTDSSFTRTFTSSNTGTFTPSCTITSSSGTSASVTTTYAVILTSTTSSTNSPGTTTTTPAIPVTTTQAFNTITPSTPVTMSNFGTDTVTQIQIEVSQTATNVNVQVDKYISKPAAVLVDKTDSYSYLHIITQNLTDKLSKATMTIQVNKTWVSGKGLAKEEVALYRYDESTNVWSLLPTTFGSEDNNYYIYNIVLDHFSYFAIAPNKAAATQTPSPTPNAKGEFLGLPYWAWVAIVVVILIIGGGFALKKKLKK